MLRLLLASLIALFLLPAAVQAQERMAVALEAETLSPRPGGEVTLALTMSPRPGWHGYWINTGDAGVPNRLQWTLPEGAALSSLRYPMPEQLVVAGLMNYVYPRPYALLGQLKLPDGIAPGTPLRIAAVMDYLVCSDTLCVPERTQVALNLKTGDGRIEEATRSQFDRWRAALPRPLGATARFEAQGGKITLGVPLAGAAQVKRAYFFPLDNGVIDYATAQEAGVAGDGLTLTLPAKPGGVMPTRLSGVLKIERADGPPLGLSLEAAPGPVAKPDRLLGSGSALAIAPFLLTLLAAVAGGFILNAMPCVFPILSLKALSLARSGESESAARKEALAYSAGVILTCVVLGGIILLLRAGGESVGWAFQLQNPHVTLLLLLLMTAIGLNLAGLFELPSLSLDHPGSPANRPSGAFLTGVLAAFVATPCTGPFMGVALGSALILPPLAALLIFAGLGIGLALPFIAIAYIPALRARLPRPGAWMETFRHILAIPMLLTAVGLGWVLGRQTGINGLTLGLIAALLTGLALWWLGMRQMRGRTVGLAVLALAVAVAGPLLLVSRIAAQPMTAASPAQDEAFSEARLDQLRREGEPVFVYFTADWCLTCKVNEQAAIDREAVRAAFANGGVKVLIGDWTNGDPAISRFLEAQGRSGVPLYLYYPAGGKAPRVLPQILTAAMLIALAEPPRP